MKIANIFKSQRRQKYDRVIAKSGLVELESFLRRRIQFHHDYYDKIDFDEIAITLDLLERIDKEKQQLWMLANVHMDKKTESFLASSLCNTMNVLMNPYFITIKPN
jgi:hypothetical protein